MKDYKIEFHPETASHLAFFEVSEDGRCIASFEKRSQASAYIEEMMMTVVLRTKRIGSYYRGILKRVYFPLDGFKWILSCQSYSGGRKSLLDLLNLRADTKEDLMKMLHKFKTQKNLILE